MQKSLKPVVLLFRAAAFAVFLSLLFTAAQGTSAHAASDTKAATGWQQSGDFWYYYSADGKPVTGFKSIGGKKFYFMDSRCSGYTAAQKGRMATGWKNINGKFYYFTDSQYPAGKTQGQMLNGWRSIGGRRYYLGTDGVRRTGFQTIWGRTAFAAPALRRSAARSTIFPITAATSACGAS